MSTNSKYFEVTVEIVVGTSKSGKEKKQREIYLVDAMTVTEAEAKVVGDFEAASIQLDYKITQAKESRIERVLETT